MHNVHLVSVLQFKNKLGGGIINRKLSRGAQHDWHWGGGGSVPISPPGEPRLSSLVKYMTRMKNYLNSSDRKAGSPILTYPQGPIFSRLSHT